MTLLHPRGRFMKLLLKDSRSTRWTLFVLPPVLHILFQLQSIVKLSATMLSVLFTRGLFNHINNLIKFYYKMVIYSTDFANSLCLYAFLKETSGTAASAMLVNQLPWFQEIKFYNSSQIYQLVYYAK